MQFNQWILHGEIVGTCRNYASILCNKTGGMMMAHVGSKGWYVKKLKEEFNVSRIEGKKLETYKSHVLHNHYYHLVDDAKDTK